MGSNEYSAVKAVPQEACVLLSYRGELCIGVVLAGVLAGNLVGVCRSIIGVQAGWHPPFGLSHQRRKRIRRGESTDASSGFERLASSRFSAIGWIDRDRSEEKCLHEGEMQCLIKLLGELLQPTHILPELGEIDVVFFEELLDLQHGGLLPFRREPARLGTLVLD